MSASQEFVRLSTSEIVDLLESSKIIESVDLGYAFGHVVESSSGKKVVISGASGDSLMYSVS